MKEKDVICLALNVIGGIILVNASITLIGYAYVGIGNAIIKSRFNKKIKKGLKDGRIIEIDGQYYEVQNETVEEVN